ncbi:MAG: choice-of-anchor J domain-containing protein [Bacteroidota bacterium]
MKLALLSSCLLFVFCVTCSASVQGDAVKTDSDLPIYADFVGFTGVNLSEIHPGWVQGKGLPPNPQTGNSAWFAGDVLYDGITATVNLDYIGLKDEWIITPEFLVTDSTKLSFMAALSLIWNDPAQGNFSHNDSVNVMVATQGYTFTEVVHAFKMDNQPAWEPAYYDFDLGEFAGETIRIGFYATNGQEANSQAAFHLDDILIRNAVSVDAMAFGIEHPNEEACFEEDMPVVATIKNDGLEPISNVPVRVRVRGPVTENLFGAYEGVIEPGDYATVEVGTIENPPYGEYVFEVETEMPGDLVEDNDVRSDIVLHNTEPHELPFPTMDFIGFYYDNLSDVYPGWYEARGEEHPRVAMNTDWQGTNYDGVRTASVYFVQLGTRDWIIGPPLTATDNLVVDFRAAVEYDTGTSQMGSDDRFTIMVSDDCGKTWQEEAAITQDSGITESLENFSFPIEGYDGEEIILAFYATTGDINDSESYLFHITDVEIRNQYCYDAAVTDLIAPANSCSFSDDEEVVVRVENFGTETISNFDVAYELEGEDPVVETITESLVHGESLDFVFDQTLDLTGDTEHLISAYTILENDENPENTGVFDVFVRLSSHDLLTEGAYTMGFEEDEYFDDWSVDNANEDGITWELEHDPEHARTGEYAYAYYSNQSSVPSDDWLISSCFNLEAGNTYYVSFHYKNRASLWPESLKLNLGDAANGDAMDQLLIDLGNIDNSAYEKAETTFTVDESGEYYFGWHAYGPEDQFGMHIDDITIYQVFDYDLTISDYVRPREKGEGCTLQPAEAMEVEVTNLGTEDISTFDVGLMLNDGDPVSFSIDEFVGQDESLWVTLENGFAIQPDEMTDIAVWTDHPEDDNHVNDTLYVEDYLMAQFYTSFDPKDDLDDWSILSLTGVNEWEHLENPSVSRTGDHVYAIRTDGAGGNTGSNDWLFSECFYLENDKCYAVSFYYRSHFSTENLTMFMGDAADPDHMDVQLIDLPEFNTNTYEQASVQFTVEEDGVYHFGWHTDGGTSGRYFIYLDDVAVVQDLEAQPMADPEYQVLDHEVAFQANAENAATYHWDFGDGHTSEEENPFHVYAEEGVYEVTLTVETGCVDATYELAVELDLPDHQVTFDINDPADQFIADAVVSVDGYENDPGDYEFVLIQGGYLFSVQKEGYEPVDGNFTVIDDDMTVTVVLPYDGDTHVFEIPFSDKLNTYPNPVNEQLNIFFDGAMSEVHVVDLSGKVLYQHTLSGTSSETVIDVSTLKPGTYIVYVVSEENRYPAVFIKQ